MSESSHLSRKENQSFFLQAVLIGGFIFIALVLFALARSIYRDSFQVGSYISDLQDLIVTERQTTVDEQGELSYAETPQFQEKTAKELLGLKNPGEKVIILSSEEQNLNQLLPNKTKKYQAQRKLLTNPQKWRRYLFGL